MDWQSVITEIDGCILLLMTAEHKGVVNKLFENIIDETNYRVFKIIFKIHKEIEQLPILIYG